MKLDHKQVMGRCSCHLGSSVPQSHQLNIKLNPSHVCFPVSAAGVPSHDTVTLPLQAKYFLRCPVTSRHAQYTWRHRAQTTRCSSAEPHCLLLIERMSPEQAGMYSCVSEEKGYTKVLTQQRLLLESRAPGVSSAPFAWLGLATALFILT